MRTNQRTASFAFTFVLVMSGLLMSGCASSSSRNAMQEDANAAAKSRVYMVNLEVFPANEKKAGQKCSVPSEALKPAPARSSGPSKEWKSFVEHANACAQAQDWKNLEVLGYALARADIDSPWGAYFLSLAAEGSGDRARALWMIDLAQKKAGGKSGLFVYQKGRILFALGEVAESMKALERAVQLDTSLTEGHVFLARIYHRDLELDRAARSYQAVLTNHSNHQLALIGLAEVKLAQGVGDEAAALYARVVANEPSGLSSWLRLAYIQETIQKNAQTALGTYRNIKTSMDRGQIKERPQFDIVARIKTLEEAVSPRVPAAQAASAKDKASPEKSVK